MPKRQRSRQRNSSPSAPSRSGGRSRRRGKPGTDRKTGDNDGSPFHPRKANNSSKGRHRHDSEAGIEGQTDAALRRWLKDSDNLQTSAPPQFVLDDWQQKAIEHLLHGDSIIVDAPTSAGKTKVCEQFLHHKLTEPGFKVVYTTPVKSLTNDKLFEMREKFGHNRVGISTGDYKENLSAPIVVATLESYRNSQLGTDDVPPPTMVVFDEYHYLGESSRGSAWEESIILTPPETQILMLSASVKNADEFCAWLRSLKNRPCYLVSTDHRPVPLQDLVYQGKEWCLAELLSPNWKRKLNPRTMKFPIAAEEVAMRILPLIDAGLAPFIIYAGRRLSVETTAKEVARSLPMLPLEQRRRIEETIQAIHEHYSSLSFIPQGLRNMIVTRGVAYHHSGLAPPARIMIEKLLKSGQLVACVSTMGLSLGINFAVRSALISDYRRPDEQGFVDYNQSEVLQMLGRAGRRGNDAVGFSVWPSLESFFKMSGAVRQPCSSNFRVEPITLMGLIYRGLNATRLEAFYRDSFATFTSGRGSMTLLKPDRLQRKLSLNQLPCRHPALDYDDFLARRRESHCFECPLQKQCHKILGPERHSLLNQHYAHLLRIGCLDYEDNLTAYGKLARYFPQNGGLLFAHRLVAGKYTATTLAEAAEFAGALALAGHKTPLIPDSYRPPFDPTAVERELRRLYPERLFPEVYDQGKADSRNPVLREWNPAGGFVIKKWLTGIEWKELEYQCTHERFGAGDLMNLIYRVATYLQSIAQLHDPTISNDAKELRDRVLRPPLSLSIVPSN